MEGILIPLTVFSCIFGIIYMFLTTRNKERMALIEKGASAELFNTESTGKWMLKLGIVAIGVALGILFASMLVNVGLLNEEIAFPAMIFLFAGLGMVASHFITTKKTP